MLRTPGAPESGKHLGHGDCSNHSKSEHLAAPTGDAAVLAASSQVFPAFTLAQHQLFASWVAWAYGTGLLSGLWPRKMPLVPAA
jgi:hypothetical protein